MPFYARDALIDLANDYSARIGGTVDATRDMSAQVGGRVDATSDAALSGRTAGSVSPTQIDASTDRSAQMAGKTAGF